LDVLAGGNSVANVAKQVVVVECNVELGSICVMWFVREADEDNLCVCSWDALLSVRPWCVIKRAWVCGHFGRDVSCVIPESLYGVGGSIRVWDVEVPVVCVADVEEGVLVEWGVEFREGFGFELGAGEDEGLVEMVNK
jgi:hypothetical protein